MSSDKLTLRQRVLDQILSAHENGIKLFICGLVHNYSVLRMGEEGPYYGGNPAYEGGQYLAGKRILNESEVTHLVLPDTILLEGFTPEWRYDPSVDQVRQKELLLTQNCYSSPTLHELIPEVDELEILVRGCDVPLADRTSVKKEIGFLSHCSDGRNLFSFCQWLRKRRQLTEYDTDLLEMFLNDRRPRRDLTNPNHYYNFYKFFESIILQASPYLAGKLSWFNPIFS
ncbi:hypothetical protein HY496_00055, partial [Candidatus Woesearchaeota archaeon]|nr:hypothetical protein [Candidatus Woesearchaeota archaeon]